MSALNARANVAHPDDIYELLIQMHEGLSETDSWRVNARLILLLVNHVGDGQAVREAIAAARQSVPKSDAHDQKCRFSAGVTRCV